MSNGIRCCILGICCPPGSPAAKKALEDEINAGLDTSGWTEDEDSESCIPAIASWILDNYDLAPKGFVQSIVDFYGPEFAKLNRKHE